jgi:hypothetical protein
MRYSSVLEDNMNNAIRRTWRREEFIILVLARFVPNHAIGVHAYLDYDPLIVAEIVATSHGEDVRWAGLQAGCSWLCVRAGSFISRIVRDSAIAAEFVLGVAIVQSSCGEFSWGERETYDPEGTYKC